MLIKFFENEGLFKLQAKLRSYSHCFPIEKVGRQDLMHLIARPSINKDIKIGKQCEAHGISGPFPASADHV